MWPEAPDIPIRIEAAAWRGKAVSFRIIQPWNDGPDRLRLLATHFRPLLPWLSDGSVNAEG